MHRVRRTALAVKSDVAIGTIWRHLREKRKSHTAYSCSYKFQSYTISNFNNAWSTQI
jgi:hypothetical protein